MEGYLSLIVCAAGLVIYAVASNPKIAEAGRILFFSGSLAFLLSTGGHSIGFLR